MSFTFFSTTIVVGAILSAQIDMLGSPRYVIREAAFTSLRKSGALGADLAKKGLRHRDLEIRSRCEALVREFEADEAGQIKPTGYDFYPWLFDLPVGIDERTVDGKIVASYGRMKVITGTPGTVRELRGLTRNMVLEMFQAGVPKEKIVAILDEMIRRERAAQQSQGLPFPDMGGSSPRRPGTSIKLTPLPKKDQQ
jgi:hypothetical protein